MIETSNEKAFSFKDKGDEIVVKRKSIRKLLSLGKDDANVRATLTVSGELPDLNLATGVNASIAPCDAPQSIFKVNIGTGSNMVLARGAFDTLEVDANTGSSFEVDARTTTNQLYVDLILAVRFSAAHNSKLDRHACKSAPARPRTSAAQRP